MFGLSAISEALTQRNRGDDVGTETVTLTVPEMPIHSHTGTTASSGAHTHTVANVPYGVQDIVAASGSGITACDETTQTVTTSSSGSHTHTFTTENTGSSNPHNNMQPTLFGVSVLIFSKFKNFVNLTPMQFK
jgi:microcystin-dependent protein